MTQDDVLLGYRLRVREMAGRTSVSETRRGLSVDRSTYYAWMGDVERGDLEMMLARIADAPEMPNYLPARGKGTDRDATWAVGSPQEPFHTTAARPMAHVGLILTRWASSG